MNFCREGPARVKKACLFWKILWLRGQKGISSKMTDILTICLKYICYQPIRNKDSYLSFDYIDYIVYSLKYPAQKPLFGLFVPLKKLDHNVMSYYRT